MTKRIAPVVARRDLHAPANDVAYWLTRPPSTGWQPARNCGGAIMAGRLHLDPDFADFSLDWS